ncbi:uncharacterized protein LOC103149342 isoform X3 [Poecilia formosa]|nr:PREDICTED: uncharacterized protein LOC103149342 isoform X3 [Poecilia formosa]
MKHTRTPSVQTSDSSAPAQNPNPTQSARDSKPTRSTHIPNPTKLAYCAKFEEVLASWLNNTLLMRRDPAVHTRLEKPSELQPLPSPDLVGMKEDKIKTAKDHDYGSNLDEAEPKENKLHITVQTGRSLPSMKKCHCCPSPQYHCPFCGPGFFKPTKLSKVKIHMDGHFNKAVSYLDYTIHRCGLGCRKRQHFHCLYCTATVLRKRDLKVHLSFCHMKHTRTPSVQTSDSSAPAQNPNPTQSARDSKPTRSTHIPNPTKLAYCAKFEEVLASWLNNTLLMRRDPAVHTRLEKPSELQPLPSPDLVGMKEDKIKTAKDHDYGSNLDEAEPKENKLHITIQTGHSLPFVKKCRCCPSPQYHCPFCDLEFFKPTKLSKLKIHLSGHIKKAIPHGDYTIHRCGLSCRKQQHFHCLYCTATVLRKRDLKVHLSCHIKRTRTPPASDQSSDSPFEMPSQTLVTTSSAQTQSPVTSVLSPNPTSLPLNPKKRACSTKLEEVLPLRPNKTEPYSLPQNPVVQTCVKQLSVVKRRCSPDCGGTCVKENQMKTEAQDHDGSNVGEQSLRKTKSHHL